MVGQSRLSAYRDIGSRHVYCHPVEQMLAVGSFCMGGILERHPNLKVAFLEGNCGWVPFLLWRMDEHWERQGDVYAPELRMAPSAYFRRQSLRVGRRRRGAGQVRQRCDR